MNKNVFFVLAVLAVLLVTMNVARADGTSIAIWNLTGPLDINAMVVYVDGEAVWDASCVLGPLQQPSVETWECTGGQIAEPAMQRGEQAVIKVAFVANRNVDNVLVHAWLRGNGKTIEDQTSTFDVYAGDMYSRSLYLDVPENWKVENGTADYTLHVTLEADNDVRGPSDANIYFDVQRFSNLLQIMSVNLENSKLNAGNTLKADVVVKNTGNHEIEDVYVKATIKELGTSQVVFLGDLAAYEHCSHDCDQQDTAEKTISFVLPKDIQTGVYTLVIEAYDGDVSVKASTGFSVESGETAGNVEITPQVTRNTVEAGESTTYTMIVTNNEQTSERIVVSASGIEGWATSEIMPASFTLAPGESKLVSITLKTNKDAVLAEHLFSAEVSYGSKTEKVNLIADLAKTNANTFGLRDTLLVIGMILAVIIVVLLIVNISLYHVTCNI